MNRILNNFVLRNLVLFLLLTGVSVFQLLAMKKDGLEVFNKIYLNIFFYGLCLFHNIVLYKKYFLHKKYVSYSMLLISAIVLFQLLLLLEEKYVLHLPPPGHSIAVWISIFFIDIMYMGLGFAVFYSFNHFKEKHDALNLEYLRRDLELKQLKEQLNPHFLFNALNNIYSYCMEDNPRSGELILKLSELMRLILKNSQRETIPIREEMAFIEYYVAFEKERLGKRCTVKLDLNVRSDNVFVAPFVFFSFIDNAFKHGTCTRAKSDIHIEFIIDHNHIHMTVINSKPDSLPAQLTGVGLSNIRRRLELLYPGRHHLFLTDERDTYKAALELNI